MKLRAPAASTHTTRTATRRVPRTAASGRFHRHPVCAAALLALAGGAQALPQGATVVAGQAAVQTQTPQLQVVTQGTPQAIIDWKSFSIAAGEKVRFDQPSSSAVLLNRVTGYDPTTIFGQMQSNGRIFLLNPYGVVFGAGARIDVGGLVASSLSLANGDFLAGRYSLTSVDPSAPAVRGAVRNEGTINAPGGTVALVGPTVANTGTIVADGGRVGLAATNQVSVDVEGDGLIFFQTSATDARVRLDQLGSIRADGGSVELRAAARGAFADTVLNLEGVVRAQGLGTRAGRVVIDGGEAGITRVAGTVDVSGLGAGERGGQATVTGYDVLLDNGARVDARGAAGGGTALVGGNWHGQGLERNADQTIVNSGASIDVSATAAGNGGAAVVWADYRTQFLGDIAARGGAQGGDGGKVETSGRQVLQALGNVDVSAPRGRAGSWLLDPNNITIKDNGNANANVDVSFTSTADSAIVDVARLGAALNGGATVVVTTATTAGSAQSGDITVQDTTTAGLLAGQTATLTLRAQRNITFSPNAKLLPGAGSLNVNLQAGTDVGATDTPGTNASTVTMDATSSINTGTSGNLGIVAKDAVQLGGLTVGGNLGVVGTGISQVAAITVGGTAGFNAGTGSIALATSTNDFGGAVTLNATGASITIAAQNALTLAAPSSLGAATAFSATAGTTLTLPAANLSAGSFDLHGNGGALATAGTLTAANGITLASSGAVTIGHALSPTGNLTLTGVGISQTAGTLTVGGTTTATAGSGDISLISASNAFTGAVNLNSTGTNVAVKATGNLALGTLTLGTDTGLTAIATGTLSGLPAGLNTGHGAIDLESGGLFTTPGDLTTNNAAITLAGAGGLKVQDNLVSAGGDITLRSGGGGGNGVIVSGNQNIHSSGGTITVDGGGAPIDVHTGDLVSTSASASAVTLHHATTVSVGPITANSGTLVLGVGGDITGAVTPTNGKTVSAKTLVADTTGSISLGTGSSNLAITNLGPVSSGNLTLDDGGTLAITGAVSGTPGSNVSITSANTLTLAADVTVSGAGTLNLKGGGGLTQTAGKITTGSTATLDAGGNSIDAQQANQFGGAVTLKATGTDAAVQATGSLTLATPSLGASTNLTAIGGTLTLPSAALTTNGNLIFASNAGALSTAGNLDAANIALTGRDGLTIGHTVTASGGVTLATTNSAITQPAGTITAAAASSFATGSGAVTLDRANHFSSIGGTGGAVTLVESSNNGVTLGTTTATSLTVTTTSNGVDVTQNGALAVSGATSITTAGGGNVTLANTANAFGSFGASAGSGAVSVAAGADLALDAVTASALTVSTATGNHALTQNAALTISGLMSVNAGSGSVTLTTAGNALGSFGATAGAVSLREDSAGIALDNVAASSLGVDTSSGNGTISQVALKTLAITGAAAFNAGTGTVNVGNTGNSFGSVGATGGTVTLRATSIALDAAMATTLLLDTSAANGAITQNGPAVVTGLATVNAGSGDITLTNAANDFSASGVNATGGAVRLRALNDLVIAGIAQGANKDLSLTAGNAISGLAGNIDTGTANLTLSAGTSFTTFGTLRGTNVAITGAGGISLGHDVTALGTLGLTTANAPIGQTAGHITASGTTTVTAGTGTVSLTQAANDFGTVNVVSGSTVAIHDANNLALSATASGDLAVDAGGVLSTSNAIAGANVSLQGTGGITLGHNVTATNGLQLTSTNAAISQTGGAISVSGLTTVSAGSGDITLTRPLNDFDDVAGIGASGGAVRLVDQTALTITGLSVGLNKDLSLTAGTTLSGVSGNIDTGNGNLTLSAGTGFSTFGTLRGTDITLFGTTGVTIGHTITALGNLNLGTTNSPIDQIAGTISAAGTTTASAGSGAITLNLAGNNFNTFAATGGAVTVRDSNGIALGPIAATSLTVDTSASNGAITSAGALTVSGNTSLNAGSGAITLGNTGNDFADVTVIGGAVSLTDKNALVLNGVNATSLAVDTSTGNGAVTQAAAITVANAVAVNAGTGNVTFTLPGNTFGSFGATGTTVTLAQAGPVVLGAINATTLSVDTSAANGAISQNAAATVTGTTTLTAGAGSISMTQAGNNFGTVAATGSAVSITDANALVLGAISASSLNVDTHTGNGAVTQSAAATVSGATTVSAGTGAVTLTQAGNDFGSVAATGGAVAIRDANAIVLGAINATTLSVDTSAGGGAVTQNGNATVTGATTVNAGSGAVALTRAGNDFATLAVTGGAVSVVDANALALTTLASGANQAVSVTAGGALTLPATAIDTGGAALTLSSGGTLDTVGTLRGTNVSLSAGAAMTIANDVTALGTLSLTTANAPITQTGGRIVATGAATVDAGASGDVQLAQATNDFQGGLALRGGALDVRDTNDLSVTSLVSAPNHAVTLRAGGTLVLPVGAIDTGTADLVLQALGGALVINGALHGNNVTLTGATGLTLGADIVSSGSQVYTSPVALGADITLDAGANKIDLQGGVSGAGHDLALKSTNAAADALHTGAAVTNVARFSVTGNATLGGNVASTGDQTYAGQVTLATGVTLDAGTAKIALQSGVDAAGNALALKSTNAAADAIRADGAIANASQLGVTGKSTFATGVSTTGAQTYSDTVTLGGTATFSGSSLTFANGIAGGASDVVLQADALSLAGTVAGSGNATLAPFTAGSSVGVAGGAGTLAIPQATLDAFAGFTTLTIGRSDGTGDLNFASVVLPTNLAVTSTSGNASFTGTVASAAGAARNLTVTTGGLTSFSGAVGGPIGGTQALGQLTVTGGTLVGASVTTTGAQTYAGALAVGADATLSGSAVNAAGALAIDTHTVAILADAISVGGPASGAAGGSLRVAPHDTTGTLGIAGGVGTLQVSQTLVDTLAGVPSLIVGRNDGSAAVNVGNLVLPGNLTVASGTGDIAFGGTVDSAAGPARNLAVTTAGTTTFGAAVGALHPVGTLTVAGPVQLGASIATTGAQSYDGTATLVADTTLNGSSVAFATTVDGSHALVVNATGATIFGGAVGATVPLASVTTDAPGTTQLGGNVTTTGAQRYDDALVLNADATLAGGTLTLAGRVDGARSLVLNGATGTSLGQPVGATTPLAALTTTGPLQLAAGSVTTSGAQAYGGPVTLGAATTLTGPAVSFAGTLDGGFALSLSGAGLTTFGAAVGGTTRLASLAAGGPVTLNGPGVLTTGTQSYGGAVQLAGDARFSGTALTFGGAVSGAHDLDLEANAITVGAGVAGTGTLAIAPLDPTLGIGVAGAPGALQVPQSILDGASGFASHVIGRTDGTGTLAAGNLVLRANTTLQSGSGDVRLNGSVDGAFDLALNTGGTTRIAGPIGATTPLRSLATDNDSAAADFDGTSGERTQFDAADATGRARVITTGAQTYRDPVVATVPIRFVGGAITADQATSRFDAGVAATADSLQLKSATTLRLDDVTLANGGRIETDGVLQIAGTLRLDGGTLTLVSNATPTGVPFTDPELQGRVLTVGFVPLDEASATILQNAGATLSSAPGTLLVLRSPRGGTLQLDQPGNTLQGDVSAVSGTLGDNDTTRFTNATNVTLGFVRLASSEIHVAGTPPADGNQALPQAGIEGDAVKLSTDLLTTGTTGQIRARLPFNNLQGSQTSVPALTLVLGATALQTNGGFGSGAPDTFIQVRLGADDGGYLTVRPKGAGQEHLVFLGGPALIKPFYDGSGKITEIRVFYNGDAPRTPQETGALAAVTAVIEEARNARFEEAVRTENVTSRLRSGVIAEVGAGRPATVGREGVRRPDTCDIKPGTLRCE